MRRALLHLLRAFGRLGPRGLTVLHTGWTHETGGKHQVKMTKPGHRPITLPANKRQAYTKGFESALRRQAGLQ